MKKLVMKMVVISITSLLLISCGGTKNTSGGSNSKDPVVTNPDIFAGGNGTALPPNWQDIIRQENPCQYGGNQRRTVTFPVQVNANVGSMYVGVTSEGDIAYIQNQNGNITLTAEICARPDLGNGGQVSQKIVVNNSLACPVGEITEAYISLQGNYGTYTLGLRPIHVPNIGIASSLCR